MARVAVVGAGVAGLAAAWALRRRGHDAIVFEAGEHAGGVVGTFEVDGWRIETGPNTVRPDARLWRLLEATGLADRVEPASRAARRRYILREGRLVPLPGSPAGLVSTPLLSARAKLRLLAEPFVGPGGRGDETVAGFVRRRFGREVLDWLVDPFVSGIHAGRPERLSAAAAFPSLVDWERRGGSVVLGGILSLGRRRSAHPKGILSFPRGLGELPARLAEDLGPALRLGAPVDSIEASGAGLRVSGTSVDAVVVAAPASAASRLLAPLGPPPAFAGIRYASVSSVYLGYDRAAIAHPLDGFGFLIPSREREPVLGVLFSSSIFPAAAPSGHVALTAFVRGEQEGDPVELVAGVCERHLGARGRPVFRHVTRWPAAIPQYEVGHLDRIAAIRAFEAARPGLFLAGSYLDGPSVPATIGSGLDAAARIG